MKILILSAFKNELNAFINLLPALKQTVINHRLCWQTTFKNADITISFAGIGNTSSACHTTALCETLKPDAIFMVGSAGGLLPNQQMGDLIISNRIVDIDLYKLEECLTATPYEPCLTDPHTNKLIKRELAPDTTLANICQSISLPRVTMGAIAATNTFPAPKDTFALIKKLGCAAIEMESAGIFNAAGYYNIPVITIRAISNSLDAQGNDLGTPPDALTICSQRIALFLNEFLEKLN